MQIRNQQLEPYDAAFSTRGYLEGILPHSGRKTSTDIWNTTPQTSCSFPYFIKLVADWKDIWSKNAANAATRGDSRLCQRKEMTFKQMAALFCVWHSDICVRRTHLLY